MSIPARLLLTPMSLPSRKSSGSCIHRRSPLTRQSRRMVTFWKRWMISKPPRPKPKPNHPARLPAQRNSRKTRLCLRPRPRRKVDLHMFVWHFQYGTIFALWIFTVIILLPRVLSFSGGVVIAELFCSDILFLQSSQTWTCVNHRLLVYGRLINWLVMLKKIATLFPQSVNFVHISHKWTFQPSHR